MYSKKYRRHYCAVCNIYTNSDNQLIQHLEGIRHRRLTEKALIMQTTTKQNINDSQGYDYDVIAYGSAFMIVIITAYIFFYFIIMFTN